MLTLARPDLLDSRPSWGGGLPGYISLPLQPLVGEEAEALAFNVLRGIEEGERQRRAAMFAEMADGNPLFIEQLAADLAERPTGSATPCRPPSAASSPHAWTRCPGRSEPCYWPRR